MTLRPAFDGRLLKANGSNIVVSFSDFVHNLRGVLSAVMLCSAQGVPNFANRRTIAPEGGPVLLKACKRKATPHPASADGLVKANGSNIVVSSSDFVHSLRGVLSATMLCAAQASQTSPTGEPSRPNDGNPLRSGASA